MPGYANGSIGKEVFKQNHSVLIGGLNALLHLQSQSILPRCFHQGDVGCDFWLCDGALIAEGGCYSCTCTVSSAALRFWVLLHTIKLDLMILIGPFQLKMFYDNGLVISQPNS